MKTFPHASGPSLVPYKSLDWQALAWGILSADAFAGKNVEILRAAFYPVRSALTNALRRRVKSRKPSVRYQRHQQANSLHQCANLPPPFLP